MIFGASGFTGQFVVEFAARARERGDFTSFAIAGRNEAKLQRVLQNASKYVKKANSLKLPLLPY